MGGFFPVPVPSTAPHCSPQALGLDASSLPVSHTPRPGKPTCPATSPAVSVLEPHPLPRTCWNPTSPWSPGSDVILPHRYIASPLPSGNHWFVLYACEFMSSLSFLFHNSKRCLSAFTIISQCLAYLESGVHMVVSLFWWKCCNFPFRVCDTPIFKSK